MLSGINGILTKVVSNDTKATGRAITTIDDEETAEPLDQEEFDEYLDQGAGEIEVWDEDVLIEIDGERQELLSQKVETIERMQDEQMNVFVSGAKSHLIPS